jgi:HEAT repeat protein
LFRKYAKDLISCGFEESHVASTVLLDLAEHSNDEAFLENLIYHLGGSTFAFSEKTIYLDALKRSRHAILRRKLAEILAWGFYNYGKDKDRDLMKPFLIDRDPAVRCYAALVRAKNRDVSVIPILKKLGKNSNQSIRSNAFFALGLLMPETADYLSSILIHNSEKLTEKDIEDIFRGIEEWEYRELKHIKDNRQKEKAAEAIANITKSANDSIALKAIKCLFEFDPENAQSQLQKYFSNKDPKIRIKSIKIARFHNQRDKILLEKIADENETEEVREQLLEEFKYDPFTKELIAILQKKIVPDKLRRKILEYAIPSAHFFFSYLNEFMMDPNICVLALDRQTRPISQLLPELENNKTPPICRISIAKNLSASTDPIVIERLLKIAADKDPAIRRAIATALGDISSSMALPGLEQLLQDPDPDVRKKAESAINKINQ